MFYGGLNIIKNNVDSEYLKHSINAPAARKKFLMGGLTQGRGVNIRVGDGSPKGKGGRGPMHCVPPPQRETLDNIVSSCFTNGE